MASVLRELSDALAETLAAAGPGVVRVEGRRRGPSSGVVWSADGLLLAAQHTLEWDEDLRVGLPDGGSAKAAVVGRDPGTDLALLRAEAGGLQPARWDEAAAPRAGQLVLAVSRPGRSARAALGVLRAVGEGYRTRAGGWLERYLEPDVGPQAGFSGSLLLDAEGRGLGLNTSGLLRGTPLCVPFASLKRVASALLEHGQVRRGYLGIGTYPVPLPGALQKVLGQAGGLLLVSVQPDSPAAQAGLLLGDTLVSVEGQAVSEPGELLPFLDEERLGAELGLRLVRAGELRELRLTVGSRARGPRPA